MDFWWEDQLQGRIIIQLFENGPFADVFMKLCSGECKHSLTSSEILVHKSKLKNTFICLESKIKWKFSEENKDLSVGLNTLNHIPGLLYVTDPQNSQVIENPQFFITLGANPEKEVTSVIGRVVSGLAVLTSLYYCHLPKSYIQIKDCGLAIPHANLPLGKTSLALCRSLELRTGIRSRSRSRSVGRLRRQSN